MPFSLDAFRRDLREDPLIQYAWQDKYRLKDEPDVGATIERVVNAVYDRDPDVNARKHALDVLARGDFIPAGRIMAGAGTGRAVTLINCFVSDVVQDSMPGIQRVITRAALTMQQGGGIGTDYSTVRPAGALVRRTGSVASGVLSFADQQNAMCSTVVSAGTRRGAMMMTLRDDHPDLWNPRQHETFTDELGRTALRYPSFITAKRDPWRLRQFNVSVLISDAFMTAVETDATWDLGFHVPPADGSHIDCYARPVPHDVINIDNEGRTTAGPKRGESAPWYVYRRARAREIWDSIMESTYRYAEPGVIFIDRVNTLNNLSYCEDIRCTNPCGEQPLPPNNVCCLGCVNLATMVRDPFIPDAQVDWTALQRAVEVGVRFLDNVLDVTEYPLEAQREEALTKRRIGLGITGFADLLIQLNVRYGSEESCDIAEKLAGAIQDWSYAASVDLARERGAFPAYHGPSFITSPNVLKLSASVRKAIEEIGIRNGVLNTIAPTGTISLAFGLNCASGLEPNFSFEPFTRRVRLPDDSHREFESIPYVHRLWNAIKGTTHHTALPFYFVGAMDVDPLEHVMIQAAWQQHIDASISKTVNCATELPFIQFREVYTSAYALGCKGCTTYRYDPESGRGAVLAVKHTDAAPTPPAETAAVAAEVPSPPMPAVRARAHRVEGASYKVKWPLTGVNWYVHVTHDAVGTPLEVFISTSSVEHQEWVQGFSRLLTAVLRRGGDFRFLFDELRQVAAATGAAFLQIGEDAAHPTRYPSIVAAIGGVLEAETRRLGSGRGIMETALRQALSEVTADVGSDAGAPERDGLPRCDKCGERAVVHESGCATCLSCGASECG